MPDLMEKGHQGRRNMLVVVKKTEFCEEFGEMFYDVLQIESPL